MKKLLLFSLLLSSLSVVGQDRVVELRHNKDNVLYAVGDVYYLNEETEPFTGVAVTIGRWSKVKENERLFINGVKISGLDFDRKGNKEALITYYPNMYVKSRVYYNADGTVSRRAKYDKGENHL